MEFFIFIFITNARFEKSACEERKVSTVRTNCVVQVPVPQIVDGAPRTAHDQRAGSKEKDVL